MKKKLLTIFTILVLIVALVCCVVACGPKNKKPTPPGPDPDPEPQVDEIDKAEVASSLAAGLNEIVDTLDAGTKEAPGDRGIDMTIALAVGGQAAGSAEPLDLDVKLHVAATASGTTAANNKALVEVIVGGTTYATLYVEGDNAYLGEALTQDGQQWFKVEGLGVQKMMSYYFPMVAGVLADDKLFPDKDHPDTGKGLKGTVGTYVGLVGTILPGLLGEVTKTEANGVTTYNMPIDFSQIGALLPTLAGQFGGGSDTDLSADGLKGMLNNLVPGLGGIIDPVVSIIFGGTLDQFLKGQIAAENAPSVALIAGLNANSELKEFGLSYASKALTIGGLTLNNVSLRLALEDVTVSSSSTLDIANANVKAGKAAANNVAIKASVNLGMNAANKKVGVDVYFVPQIKIGWADADADHPQGYFTGLDMSGTKAFAIGTVGDNTAQLGADLQLGPWKGGTDGKQKSALYLDIAGLYTLAGITNHEGKTRYKLEFLFGGDPVVASEPVPGPQAVSKGAALAAGNIIDAIVDGIQDALTTTTDPATQKPVTKVDIMGVVSLVMDNIGGAVNALKGLVNDIVATVDTQTEGQITVDFGAVLAAITSNTTLTGSDTLKLDTLMNLFSSDEAWLERFDGKNDNLMSYFTSVEKIVEFVNIVNGKTAEAADAFKANTVLQYANQVAKVLGLSTTDNYFADVNALNDLLQPNGITLTIKYHRDTTKGLGFEATVKINNTTVATLGMSMDIVAASTVTQTSKLTDASSWTSSTATIGDGNTVWTALWTELQKIGMAIAGIEA